ncbi:MAG: XrtA/PEP-CTERM system exopolysaccharide export protein [Solirubrobacterales bacterium]
MLKSFVTGAVALASATALSGCGAFSGTSEAPMVVGAAADAPIDYLVGPGDEVQVFVWRAPELSTKVRVRPDGRISVPLIEDMPVAGKPPAEVAREIERQLGDYVRDPKVTVMISEFVGQASRQIRVVGQAAKPQAIPFHKDMTVLDVVIAAGGLTQFADGNGAVLVRGADGKQARYRVRLADLMKEGDLSANVPVAPGDLLLIPESWF